MLRSQSLDLDNGLCFETETDFDIKSDLAPNMDDPRLAIDVFAHHIVSGPVSRMINADPAPHTVP